MNFKFEKCCSKSYPKFSSNLVSITIVENLLELTFTSEENLSEFIVLS
jgi:hypothetical protein